MVKKLWSITIICTFLFGMATFEIVTVQKVNENLETKVEQIYSKFEASKDNIVDLLPDITDLKECWDGTEQAMSLMFNYKDLSTITTTITKLYVYIKNNDYVNAAPEMYLLKDYADKNQYLSEFNVQNLL